MRLAWWGAALLPVLATGGGLFLQRSETPLPPDLAGTLVFVSDRPGMDCPYVRRPPGARKRRLTYLSEPTREPALSPDGREAALLDGGRIGLVSLAGTLARSWLHSNHSPTGDREGGARGS